MMQAVNTSAVEAVDIKDVTVIMPLAGRATRAREVTKDTIPKHLIPLGGGMTVLDTICRRLQEVGFRRFVFCVGFLKEHLIKHVDEKAWIIKPGVSYAFDITETLLGVDGTVLHAIEAQHLGGQAMIVPGDIALPWGKLVDMNLKHAAKRFDITLGVTSFVTERTTDVGKLVFENKSDKLIACYDRTQKVPPLAPGTRGLTSAAATTISVDRYRELGRVFREMNHLVPLDPISLRDDMLPWIVKNGGFDVRAYDIKGEILDLGTPANIYYAQKHWQDYV